MSMTKTLTRRCNIAGLLLHTSTPQRMSNAFCKAGQRMEKGICLKEICFQAVRQHFHTVGVEAVLGLPVPLIKDLLPHLTICQLDELQPPLNQRGISTHSGWASVFLDMCGSQHVIDSSTEEEAKYKVMKALFTSVFYGFTSGFIKRNITNLKNVSFLKAAAKCVRKFTIMNVLKPLQALTTEQWPLLKLLETCIESVDVSNYIDLSKKDSQIPLYVLHRLLDHGVAKYLSIHGPCPIMLAWLLHGRGSQFTYRELRNLMECQKTSCVSASARADGAMRIPAPKSRTSEGCEDEDIPCKRFKLDSVSIKDEECGKTNFAVDPQTLCQMFTPCDSSSAAAAAAAACYRGQIECLQLHECGSDCLQVLFAALPTFFCLRSLTLNSSSTFRDSDVSGLANALRQLCHSSCSSLTNLNISVLPHPDLVEVLLDAGTCITSLHVEIHTVTRGLRFSQPHCRTAESDISAELPLKKLTVKLGGVQTNLDFITSVLRRSPYLTSLHVTGLRLPAFFSHGQLLTTLSESNHGLRDLILEDINLSDCLTQILHLLRDCKLKDLQFKDCRLLEKWSNKEESLQQLVAALKEVASLHTLSLAQNRLAKNVCVLVELFTGSSPSSVKRLDLSSNFIQPAELLEFAKRLQIHRPSQQLSLDLRRNPGDRDPQMWNTAMEELRPFCHLQVEGWISTNTMADHISNM